MIFLNESSISNENFTKNGNSNNILFNYFLRIIFLKNGLSSAYFLEILFRAKSEEFFCGLVGFGIGCITTYLVEQLSNQSKKECFEESKQTLKSKSILNPSNWTEE